MPGWGGRGGVVMGLAYLVAILAWLRFLGSSISIISRTRPLFAQILAYVTFFPRSLLVARAAG